MKTLYPIAQTTGKLALALAALWASAPASAFAQQIQATGAQDLNFGIWYKGDGSQQLTRYFCVYKDSGGSTYGATVTGDGGGGAFELSDGSGNNLPFTVTINAQAITAGVLETGLAGADLSSPTCSGSPNQELEITIGSPDLGSAPVGLYTGNLTITVEP